MLLSFEPESLFKQMVVEECVVQVCLLGQAPAGLIITLLMGSFLINSYKLSKRHSQSHER